MTKIVTIFEWIALFVKALFLCQPKRVIGLFPHKLPVGLTEFDAFYKKICQTYAFPPSAGYRQAVATMVMHLEPTVCWKQLQYFGDSVMKAQANEVAYQVLQMLKEEQKAEQEKAKLEATKTDESHVEPISH